MSSLRERYLAKLKRLGQLSFEDRLKRLFDEGTVRLLNASDWDEGWQLALVTAAGTIDGRPVLAYATNFLKDDGTFGKKETGDVVALLKRAHDEKLPVVALLHSNGARVSEGYAALSGNAALFFAMTRLSGIVPQLTACMGLASGIPAYIAGLSDLVWMIAEKSYVFTTSPQVVKVATGRQASLADLGGAEMHAKKSGVAHFLAATDELCLDEMRRVVVTIGNARQSSRAPAAVAPGGASDVDIAAILPRTPFAAFDVRKLIAAVFDPLSFIEVHARWAETIVVGFAHLEGRVVGVVANQSKVRSGALEVESVRKASRFCQLSDSYGIPLIFLVDVPGIMVSVEQEQAGILTEGAIFFHAVDVDVPRIALVVRKCFGGAFVMLQSRESGGDCVLAYPDARIGITGAEAAFAILHGKEYLTHEDPEGFKKGQIAALKDVPMDAQAAVAAGIVDRVIAPNDTRQELTGALVRFEKNGPRARTARKHPNFPF